MINRDTRTTPETAAAPLEGTIAAGRCPSAAVQEDIDYYVYLPAGYQDSSQRYPVFYLLHGRGDTMAAWARTKPLLDQLIAAGDIPPVIAIMPDAPWSQRANFYVDSEYSGPFYPGRKVETAFITELIPHVDATYRTISQRWGRIIAGYSMGGDGALRYALAHADLFMGSIVLSPAVYVPLPPLESSTREFGAFGKGNDLFDETVWAAKNYPEASRAFLATGLTSYMFIAVGDDEYKHPDPADYHHDLDFEAHVLYNYAWRLKNLSVEFRVLEGGHTWDVWTPAFVEGAKYLFRFMKAP